MTSVLAKLDLRGAAGDRLTHRFFRQSDQPAGLLYLLPGHAYSGDGPLLYYPAQALRESGWDTLAIAYSYQGRMADASAEVVAEALQESRQALAQAMAARPYPSLALLGKSLGSCLAAYLASDMPELAAAPAAYLTPLVGTPMFDAPFAATHGPAYLALGTADRYADLQALEALKTARPYQLTTIEGADHAMNIIGDLEASIRVMRRITFEVVDFIGQHAPANRR